MIAVSVLLLVLAVLGAPLFAIIATSAMVGFHSNETELMTIALELLSISQMPILTAIPLFTFAGYILSESDAPKRLVRLTNAFFGWMPGGLALVCLAVRVLHGLHRRVRRYDHRAWRDPLPGTQAGRLR